MGSVLAFLLFLLRGLELSSSALQLFTFGISGFTYNSNIN
jgi:hypothetical protein